MRISLRETASCEHGYVKILWCIKARSVRLLRIASIALCVLLICAVCSASPAGYSYSKAERLFAAKNYALALEYYNKTLDQGPEVISRKGDAFRMMKRYNESLGMYDEAISMDPSTVQAWAGKAETYLAVKDLVNASNALSVAVDLDPKNKQYLYKKGCCLQKMGALNESLGYFDRAISADPKYLDAKYSKGISLQALGSSTEAKKLYDGIISANPKYVLAHNARGMILESEGDIDRALEAYNAALNVSSGNWQAKCGAMHCLMALGREKEAVEMLLLL